MIMPFFKPSSMKCFLDFFMNLNHMKPIDDSTVARLRVNLNPVSNGDAMKGLLKPCF